MFSPLHIASLCSKTHPKTMLYFLCSKQTPDYAKILASYWMYTSTHDAQQKLSWRRSRRPPVLFYPVTWYPFSRSLRFAAVSGVMIPSPASQEDSSRDATWGIGKGSPRRVQARHTPPGMSSTKQKRHKQTPPPPPAPSVNGQLIKASNKRVRPTPPSSGFRRTHTK